MNQSLARWGCVAVLVLAIWPVSTVSASEAELREELRRTREELVNAINETRAAYAEEIKTRREFVARLTAEMQNQARTLAETQQQLAVARQQIAELEARNQQLAASLERQNAEIKTLLAEEVKQRQAADQSIVKELSEALAKGLNGLQQRIEDGASRPPAGGAATTTMRTYTVVAGDTLSAIAQAFGLTITRLKEVNNLTGDTIRVGQELKIPQE